MNGFSLPRIYPITDARISGLTHIEQVSRFIEGGATLIQLRDKAASSGDFYRMAEEAVRFARPRGVKILVNDRVDIAIAAGADGVHLGQNDLHPEHARRLMGERAIIGFSTHNIEQVREALGMPLDYIAFGPVYATSTKTDPDPVAGLDGLRAASQAAKRFPIVAIGGITRATVAEVLGSGADSAALISDLLSDPDEIASRLRSLMG